MEELNTFLDMVKEGKDELKESRCEAIGRFVKHFDGKNGTRIKEYIDGLVDRREGKYE